jgi:hypothetical protein
MLEGASPDVPKIFGSAGALPSRKTTRYSPFAIRCCFGSAGASLSQFIPSLVPRPTPRFKLVATKTKPVKQANKKLRVLGCAFREKALTLNSQPATRNPSSSHPPRVGVQIRHHSLLAIRHSLNRRFPDLLLLAEALSFMAKRAAR